MRIFGRKSAGAKEARPPLARPAGMTMGDWPRGYEAQVREAYLGNAVAQRAVRLVADGLASAPLRADNDAALALVVARSGGQTLLETVAAQMLLHGNAFIQVMADEAGTVRELFALRPERVTIEPGRDGWPAAYRYRVGEMVTRMGVDAARPEVIHLKSFNPVDDHYGLGCLIDAGAAEIADALPGARVSAEADGIVVEAPGLSHRWIEEARLRWIGSSLR